MLYLLTLLLYAVSTINLYIAGPKKWPLARVFFLVGTSLAIICHAALLHQWIDAHELQNLSFVNIFSLTAWLVCLLAVLISIRQKENLNLFYLVLPITLISILFVPLFETQSMMNTEAHPDALLHILLSLLTFSVFSLAALQAITLAFQEHQLHKHRLLMDIEEDPIPLERTEMNLFRLLSFGFVLLTILILTSFFSFDNVFNADLIGKTVLAMISWVIFGVLLLGRFVFGWRGRKAIYSSLAGFGLLIVIYYGSQFLIGWIS